jgi:hypothetical protein
MNTDVWHAVCQNPNQPTRLTPEAIERFQSPGRLGIRACPLTLRDTRFADMPDLRFKILNFDGYFGQFVVRNLDTNQLDRFDPSWLTVA